MIKLQQPIVLASSSEPRKQLLGQLGIQFDVAVPDIDETPLPFEQPEDYVIRLAQEKANAVVAHVPSDAIIIAADQTVYCDSKLLGKPGDYDRACQQLMSMQGKNVRFFTALALLNVATSSMHRAISICDVKLRKLTEKQIETYVNLEKPYQCAGSFKSEGLGVALATTIRSEDQTALVGLPLTKVVHFLALEGIELLG